MAQQDQQVQEVTDHVFGADVLMDGERQACQIELIQSEGRREIRLFSVQTGQIVSRRYITPEWRVSAMVRIATTFSHLDTDRVNFTCFTVMFRNRMDQRTMETWVTESLENLVRNESEERSELILANPAGRGAPRTMGTAVRTADQHRGYKMNEWIIVKRFGETHLKIGYAYPTVQNIPADDWYDMFYPNRDRVPVVHFRDHPQFPPNVPMYSMFEKLNYQSSGEPPAPDPFAGEDLNLEHREERTYDRDEDNLY